MLLDAANLIGPETRPIPGEVIVSRNPAHPDRVIWSGSPGTACVDDAVGAACAAQAEWAGAPIDQREAALRAFQALATEHVEELADLICDETGKPRWDALGEAKLLAGKVDVTLDVSFEKAARHRVADYELEITPTRRGAARFRPHGVMAVVGPFNFPMHLPNGHIVPALLMG
ncbi:MAG: aldehyde dehydrogenase family protein, partial [Planctomycetota bacterium]